MRFAARFRSWPSFVRDHDLLDQDPDKPLVVRETPEYMRGTGAIASVSAPGPFNPGADTYYNVTPLSYYGEELAASLPPGVQPLDSSGTQYP